MSVKADALAVAVPTRPLRPRAMFPALPRSLITLTVLLLLGLVALWNIKDLQNKQWAEYLARHRHGPHATPNQPSKHASAITWAVSKKAPATPPVSSTEWKVPVEASIMSLCPDASDCLVDLFVPAMSKLPSLSAANITLSYIGQVTEPDGGVSCRHGPSECLGNILQLCARELYPDPKQWLGFAMCTTKELEHFPARHVVQDCALDYGISFDKLNECASKEDGSYGMGLLRRSVERTKAAGVTLSCTIRLDEQTYCIRDDGEWKDCPNGSRPEDLVKAIEDLYQRITEKIDLFFSKSDHMGSLLHEHGAFSFIVYDIPSISLVIAFNHSP